MRKIQGYTRSLLLLCLTALLFTGCSHYVIPEPQGIDPAYVPAFTSTKTFQITNNQPSKEKMEFGESGIGTFYGTLSEFTNEAVKLTTSELKKRGMTSSDDGEKVIKLAITHVEALDRFVYNCVIAMDVETKNGYQTTINANRISMSGGQGLWGGAITNVVTELLKDENIIAYLKE